MQKKFSILSFVEKMNIRDTDLVFSVQAECNLVVAYHNSVVLISNFTNFQAIQRSHASFNTKLLYLNTREGEKLLIR